MTSETPTILVAEDEPLNVELIRRYLVDEGYELVFATDGQEAWSILESQPEKFDAVLLDRMMPRMDGMQVLDKIKTHPILKYIPVIIQTALSSEEKITEGIEAGAYYYLTKPYRKDTIRALVKTAITDRRRFNQYKSEFEQQDGNQQLMGAAHFTLYTLEEAQNLARLLASNFPNPGSAIFGLTELLVNAVEHGNLEINYQEKSKLNKLGHWQQEVAKRLQQPEYKNRHIDVHYERTPEKITISIKDQGKGFDWHKYMNVDPQRFTDSHGRGITISRSISFDKVEYLGKGNEVLVTTYLKH